MKKILLKVMNAIAFIEKQVYFYTGKQGFVLKCKFEAERRINQNRPITKWMLVGSWPEGTGYPVTGKFTSKERAELWSERLCLPIRKIKEPRNLDDNMIFY